MDLVRASHLSKRYGAKEAVIDVSFSVAEGEVLGLLGPNGAGKTSTLRMLAGFLPPTSGTAQIAGFDVLTQSLEARRHLGYLPENVPLYADMTVWEFLQFIANARRLGRQSYRAIMAALEECRLQDVRDTVISKLSRGYRQRVGLAQAILHSPDVLILDEPTVGLDPRQITEIRGLIRELGERHAVILSTHILPEVSMLCRKVVIISDGRVAAEDTPENLTARLAGTQRWTLAVRGPAQAVLDAVEVLPGVVHAEVSEDTSVVRVAVDSEPDESMGERLAAAIVNRSWGLRELRPAGMSLEEVFLRLTTSEPEEPADRGADSAPEEAAAHAVD